ncbi:MAG: alpha/beta fold hydrolase [Paracoccaceae bacterium]
MGWKARKDAPGDFAHLSQGTTHFQWYGPSKGPVLVCVHGLTTPSFVFSRLAPGLALLGYRVLVYDLYGRGYSNKPKGPQDTEFFVRQLRDLLAHQKLENKLIALMGYSMGGAIATAFAFEYPERVTRMILFAPAGINVPQAPMIRVVRDVPVLGDWVMHAIYPTRLRQGIRAEGDVEFGPLQLSQLRYRGFVQAVLASLRGILSVSFEQEHKYLVTEETPILVVWGEKDSVIPLSCKETLSTWNPTTQHIVIHDAGHGLIYTNANRILVEITDFLTVG